jgi:hypothetical protein
MFAADLLKDRYGSMGAGKGAEVPFITENLLKSFGFTANPPDNPVRITTDKVLLRGECASLSKTILQIISTFQSNIGSFLFSLMKLLNIFLHPQSFEIRYLTFRLFHIEIFS